MPTAAAQAPPTDSFDPQISQIDTDFVGWVLNPRVGIWNRERPKVVVKQTIQVGKEVVIEAPSPSTSFCVVFEDDGDTGYFYGLDTSRSDNPILDALHIYNVSSVTDKDIPSVVQIVWSADGLKAALAINRYVHAVFDFEAKRGYCRTGFPPTRDWSALGHDWDDKALKLFKKH